MYEEINIENILDNISEHGKQEIIKEIKEENRLIKKPSFLGTIGKFDLSALQQDLMDYLFYRWQDVDLTTGEITLKVSEIRQFLDTGKHGNTNNDIKEAYKEIRDKSIWVKYIDDKGEEVQSTFAYFNQVDYKKNRETIKLYITQPALKVITYGLQKYFSLYNFKEKISVKGKYAKRFYDMFYALSYKNKDNSEKEIQHIITIENLKNQLHLYKKNGEDKYTKPSDLNRKVVEPSIKELNDKTALDISYIFTNDKKIDFKFNKNTNIFKENLRLNENQQNFYSKVLKKAHEQEEEFAKTDEKVAYSPNYDPKKDDYMGLTKWEEKTLDKNNDIFKLIEKREKKIHKELCQKNIDFFITENLFNEAHKRYIKEQREQEKEAVLLRGITEEEYNKYLEFEKEEDRKNDEEDLKHFSKKQLEMNKKATKLAIFFYLHPEILDKLNEDEEDEISFDDIMDFRANEIKQILNKIEP